LYALLLNLAQVLLVSNGIKVLTVSGKLLLNATYVMASEGDELMAYWSYRPCTLLIAKLGNPIKIRVRNLCPFPIRVPITVKSDIIIKSALVKKLLGCETTALTFPKCLSTVCLSSFPLGEFKCIKKGIVTLTTIKIVRGGFLVLTKTKSVCLEEARKGVCVNWSCTKVVTETRLRRVCSYTNSLAMSSGSGINPISMNVYVPQGSVSEELIIYRKGRTVIYAWGLPYLVIK